MYLIQKIEECAAKYADARRSIAMIILDHRKDLYKLSMADIADLSATSKATVVRFAKTLGYTGWKEFRKDFLAEMQYLNSQDGLIDANYPFESGSSTEDTARAICQLMEQSAHETLQKMDFQMIDRAVSLIVRANKIVIFSVSPHIYTAKLFARKMMTIQKNVQVCTAREMGITVRTLTSRDLAILVSYAGNNPQMEPMNLAEYLISNKIPTVVITSEGTNYLRNRFSNVLTIPSRENLFTKIATFASEEAEQLIYNTLFACCFGLHYEENDAQKLHTARFLETHDRTNEQNSIPL